MFCRFLDSRTSFVVRVFLSATCARLLFASRLLVCLWLWLFTHVYLCVVVCICRTMMISVLWTLKRAREAAAAVAAAFLVAAFIVIHK